MHMLSLQQAVSSLMLSCVQYLTLKGAAVAYDYAAEGGRGTV